MRRAVIARTLGTLPLLLSPLAWAQITVEPPGTSFQVDGDNNVLITAQGTANGAAVTVRGGGSAAIGVVSVLVNGGVGDYLRLSVLDARSVRGVAKVPSNAELWVDLIQVAEDVGNSNPATGAISGSLQADIIDRVRAGRDIVARVQPTGVTAVSPAPGLAINLLQAGNDILGTLDAGGVIAPPLGATVRNVGRIIAGGDIASVGDVVRIQASGDLALIQAQSIVGAQIDLGDSAANGTLARLTITNGDFRASVLTARRLNDLFINGDFQGFMWLAENPTPTDPAGWLINGAFGPGFVDPMDPGAEPSAWLRLPAGGLRHQIVVNADNLNTARDVWGCLNCPDPGLWDVVIAEPTPIVLRDGYGQTPAHVGGGSVGRLPFTVHRSASLPANGSDVLVASIDRNSTQEPPPCVAEFYSVRIAHYGRVEVNGPPAVAVRVWKRPLDAPEEVDVSGEFRATADGRDLRVRRVRMVGNTEVSEPWELNATYRIRPVPGRVRCVVQSGGPTPDVAPYDYTVTLRDGCRALFDLNLSGLPEAGDVPAFAGDPVDFDQSGDITARDLSILLRGIAEHGAPLP